MVSDLDAVLWIAVVVSIRFEVRGGFRRRRLKQLRRRSKGFQSALRFAVVSDED